MNINKINKLTEIAATVLTIVGYTLITQQLMLAGILVAIVGNIVWILWAWFQTLDMKGLIIVNSFMLCAGIVGLIQL